MTPVPPQNTLSATAATDKKGDRFAAIDGLRALACLGVVFHHCYLIADRFEYPRATIFGANFSLSRTLSYGYTGVDLFFVLSAFCLSYPLLKPNAAPFQWSDYLQRRARRILPPYYAAWILLFVGGLVIHKFSVEPLHSAGVLGFSKPRDMVLGLFLIFTVLNGSFWTLCLEARWYFVLPILLSMMKKYGWRSIAIVGVVVSLLFYFLVIRHEQDYHWMKTVSALTTALPFYLPIFILGILAAHILVTSPKWLYSPQFLLLLRSIFLISFVTQFILLPPVPSGNDQLQHLLVASGLAFSSLLLALLDKVVARILSNRFLVAIGVASYSIYLIHSPLIDISYAYTKSLNWSVPMQWLWYNGVIPVLVVLAGFGFFALFERPLLKKRPAVVPKTTGTIPSERGIS